MTDEQNEDASPNKDESCPVCEKKEFCEAHHLATFAVTEGSIMGGAVFDHEEEIDDLLLSALVLKRGGKLPEPFGDLITELMELADSDDEDSLQDSFSENHGQVLDALREYFSWHKDVICPDTYEVQEYTGTWAYEDHWSEHPKRVVEELLEKLRVATAD